MRTKSVAKRQAILDAAQAVFQDAGFERTSMEDIRKRAGFSKATLYSYFASKEELFVEFIQNATEAQFQASLAALDATSDDIGEALSEFGTRYLTLMYLSPLVMAVRRLVVSEAARAGLGPMVYQLGPERTHAAIGAFLGAAMAKGKLRQADTRLASQHLIALIDAEWLEPFLCQTLDTPTVEALGAAVRRGVAVFLAAYGAAA